MKKYSEEPVRLSETVLWDLQKKAYVQFGIESWTRVGVPFHITSNARIANQYAKMALPLFKQGPVTFLELGGGSGRFAYLFISALLELGVQDISIRYLLTDFSEKNVSFWKTHPLLISWIDKGILCPLIYDPLTDQDLPFSPQYVIASYFFDTVPQDIFRIEKGQLFEGLVSVSGSRLEDLQDPREISSLSLEYSYRLVPNGSYFHDEGLDSILEFYRKTLSDGVFLFPLGGLLVLQRLFKICDSPFTLLLADRGLSVKNYTDVSSLFNLHGTFSFPVNFDLISQFFQKKGGEAYLSTESTSRFIVGLFSSGKVNSLSKEFFVLQHFGLVELKKNQLKDLLEYLEKMNWDAPLFFSYFDRLVKLLSSATEEEKIAFLKGAFLIHKRFYPLMKEEAVLLDQLGFYLEGIGGKKESEQLSLAAQLYRQAPGLLSLKTEENDFSVLIIGHSYEEIYPCNSRLTRISLDLEELQSLGKFDLILFFPQSVEKKQNLSLGNIFQEIEEKFPEINEIVYRDEDLLTFVDQLDSETCMSPKYVIQFFVSLRAKKQITQKQLENVFLLLEERCLISSEDRAQFSVESQPVDEFEILICALKDHMKKEASLKGVFSHSFKDERFLNEIVANPYLDYKEENESSPQGEDLLFITIKKWDM